MRKEEAAGHGVSGKGLLAVHRHYFLADIALVYESLTYFDAKFCQFLFSMCRHMQNFFAFIVYGVPLFPSLFLSVGHSWSFRKWSLSSSSCGGASCWGYDFRSAWKEDEETSLATADTFGIAPSSHTFLLFAPHICRDRCKEGTKRPANEVI